MKRTATKYLVLVFFVVAAGLVYLANREDEGEIAAQVEERVEEAVAKREQEIGEREEALNERLEELRIAREELDNPIYTTLNADHIEEVLTRMGVTYEIGEDDQGDPQFDFRLSTYKVWLYFYGCEEEGCTSIRLYSGFDMDDPPSVERINEWNKTKRFSTAYISNSGNVCLDDDLVVRGGITIGAVERFILTFRDRLNEYTAHIGY